MNPVAFSIFGLGIMWYGILIALGVIAAIPAGLTGWILNRYWIYSCMHFRRL